MSDSDAIKVGDTVMVAYAQPCGCVRSFGLVFEVDALLDVDDVAEARGQQLRCRGCLNVAQGDLAFRLRPGAVFHISSLIKLPPNTEVEDIATTSEVVA